MKQFYWKNKNKVWWQALRSASILSLFVYGTFRLTFFEYTLSWKDELALFTKFFLGSTVVTYIVTVGIAMLYLSLIRLKRAGKIFASR